MRDEAKAGTNRNGLVGEFLEFAPPRLELDDIVRRSFAKKSGTYVEEGRTSRELASEDGYTLVRYRLGSDEIRRDSEAVAPDFFVSGDLAHRTAVFGVLDADGTPQAILQAYDIARHGCRLQGVFGAPGRSVGPLVMARFLALLDARPTHGTDHRANDLFDVRFDGEAGWVAQEPRHFVKITFERVCFATRPAMRETTDVLVPLQPGFDLDDPDKDKADDAAHRYRSFGMALVGGGVRPGFSSWGATGKPEVVKVVGDALDGEIGPPRPLDDGPAAPRP